MGFLERLKDGLSKTRRNFTDRIEELVGMSAKVDEDFLEELEMILLSGDVGVKTTEKLIDAVRQAAKKKEIEGTEQVMPFLKKYIAEMLQDEGQRTRIGAKPTVILVVGVNGVGKTTTIGKLANYFHLFKYKVMLASVPPLPNSCRFGASVPAAKLSVTKKALTRLPWFLTLSKPLLPAMSTYFLLTLPDGCIIKPI
jgi:signal recognition particle GTPase